MHDAIEHFMTHSLHTIGVDRSVAEARALMSQHRIRHLPVLEGGELVGIVSERDLALVGSFQQLDPKNVKVEDAMSPEVFTVSLETPVGDVAQRMAREKLGSAVVLRGSKPVGIFTCVDALGTLQFFLQRSGGKEVLDSAMKSLGAQRVG